MIILGIESSCDETAAAIVEDGIRLHSNVIHSQIDIHKAYGGVVPEVAARSHLEIVNLAVTQALQEAELDWDAIDAIAVTNQPGLSGSLLIGSLTARTLALLRSKPLVPVHHVEAHVYANFITQLEEKPTPNALATVEPLDASITETSAARDFTGAYLIESRREAASAIDGTEKAISKSGLQLPATPPSFPLLALIVSGGHSQLVLFHGHGNYELLGQTQDDAVGEAFDKVAKILGLPYPGGPSIAAAAIDGDAHRYALPKAKLANPYDFSFSGLKTAVLRAVQHEVGKDFTFPSHELAGLLDDVQRRDFAASFQRVAIETLVDKTKHAYESYLPKSVVIAGGVAANQELRRQLSAALPLPMGYAPIQLCTDNAAMVASLGYFKLMAGVTTTPYEMSITPSIPMSQTAWT